MKKIFFSMLIFVLVLTGCSSNGSTSNSKNATDKDSVKLKNGMIVTVKDKKLVDAYGDYYTEDGAILQLDLSFENPTDKKLSTGTSMVSVVINDDSVYAQSLGDDTLLQFIEDVKAGDTLESTAIFGSKESYTEDDKVTIEFRDITDEVLGTLDLDLVGIKKEESSVTKEAGEAKKDGNMIVHEMDDVKLSIGNQTSMTSDEFIAAYPDYTLEIQNKYRYLLFDVEMVNGTSEAIDVQAKRFLLTDEYDDVALPTVAMNKMKGDQFDLDTDVEPGETRKGKIVYRVAVDTKTAKITSNPVGGLNSEFVYEFKLNLK